MDKKIFFQSSLPRAGSTMLQNIMGQNPDFYVTPTSGVLELLYSARGQYSTSPEFKAQDSKLMKKGWLSFCKAGINGFFNGVTDKPYILDKSRGWGVHSDFLGTFIDEPKIICMVRDIRSVYTSMEKNFRKHPEKDSGIVDWSTGKCTTTEKRVNFWAESPPIGIAIERIKQIIAEGRDKNILFVKYEDFCENPKEEMKKIYNYLDLPEYNHDFDNIEQITVEDDTIYGIFGDHKINPTVKVIKPNYNEILGEDLSNNIYNSYGWFHDYFNYSI